MREVVLWSSVALVAFVVVVATVVAITYWKLQRRNRVSPKVSTGAPLSWLWATSPAARMHRGLQRAVQAVTLATHPRTGPEAPEHLRALADEIEREAVALDQHLVVLSRLPKKPRKRALHDIAPQVAEVERLADRLAAAAAAAGRLSDPAGTPTAERGLAWVAERLELLESARGELRRLELAAGGPAADDLMAQLEVERHAPTRRLSGGER